MNSITPRLHKSHFLSYEKLVPRNVSTTSGAMNSAEPTGVRRVGVVELGVREVEAAILLRSKSQIFTGMT